MDIGSIASAIIALFVAVTTGLGWLFKLHGDMRVLKAQLAGEVELRKALEARVNGFEQRIYEQLETIIEKLDRKADK